MPHGDVTFDRVPADEDERENADRATREEILDYWTDRFGIEREVFEPYTFWERGKGKIWLFRGDAPDTVPIQGLGMTFLRTRQEFWKPTTDAVQRFGGHATENVLHLDRDAARAFVAGEDQEIEWDGDWGYLIVTHDIAGGTEPLGVGLYTYGELKTQVAKGRQRDL
jgi:NOL1/NOP2/fmu family ribosome biogenesis protein